MLGLRKQNDVFLSWPLCYLRMLVVCRCLINIVKLVVLTSKVQRAQLVVGVGPCSGLRDRYNYKLGSERQVLVLYAVLRCNRSKL